MHDKNGVRGYYFVTDATSTPSPHEQHIVILKLNEEGFIEECVDSGQYVLGDALSPQLHISGLLPKLKDVKLISEDDINPRLRFLSHIGHQFLITLAENRIMLGTLFFRCYREANRNYIRLIICPEFASVPC